MSVAFQSLTREHVMPNLVVTRSTGLLPEPSTVPIPYRVRGTDGSEAMDVRPRLSAFRYRARSLMEAAWLRGIMSCPDCGISPGGMHESTCNWEVEPFATQC